MGGDVGRGVSKRFGALAAVAIVAMATLSACSSSSSSTSSSGNVLTVGTYKGVKRPVHHHPVGGGRRQAR